MSEVTNLIISFSYAEDEQARIKEVRSFKNNGRKFNPMSADFERNNESDASLFRTWYGGTKFLETPLYIGAFNHLDLNGLIKHLTKMKWEEPEYVQLIIKDQTSEKFRIIEIT